MYQALQRLRKSLFPETHQMTDHVIGKMIGVTDGIHAVKIVEKAKIGETDLVLGTVDIMIEALIEDLMIDLEATIEMVAVVWINVGDPMIDSEMSREEVVLEDTMIAPEVRVPQRTEVDPAETQATNGDVCRSPPEKKKNPLHTLISYTILFLQKQKRTYTNIHNSL